MTRRRSLLTLAAVVALLGTGCVQRLGGASGADLGLPVDINDVNDILAVSWDEDVPFGVLLADGPNAPGTPVVGPGGIGFRPYALNDSGVVVGETIDGTGYQQQHRAVSWSAASGFTALPQPADTYQSWATDINTAGDIVFNAYSPSGSSADGAYIWRPGDATATKLPDPDGASNGRPSVAEAINDAGVIAGASGYGSPAGAERAVRWAAGTRLATVLGSPGTSSRGLDINERGTVVGGAITGAIGSPEHAVAWVDVAGVFVDLGPGIAEAVNDQQFAVGQAGTPARAYAWSTVTRTAIPLEELREGAGSNATALNNRARAVGHSDRQAVQYSLPTE